MRPAAAPPRRPGSRSTDMTTRAFPRGRGTADGNGYPLMRTAPM